MLALWGMVTAAVLTIAAPSANGEADPATPQLQPGSRVRFWSPKLQESPRVAVVREVREDEIIVKVEGRTGEIRAPFADLDRLEVDDGDGL